MNSVYYIYRHVIVMLSSVSEEKSRKVEEKEVLMSKFSPLTTTLVQDKNVHVHSYIIGRKPFLN